MKATIRNSRKGSADHNDRNYDISIDGHIDKELMKTNIYWNCYGDTAATFSAAETRYYNEHYSVWTEEQNRKHIEGRHKELCRTTDDLLMNKRYSPEETWLQIGGVNGTVDEYTFEVCVREYIEELKKYDSNIHILDWAIHFDEATPHAHIRKVYDYIDENGHRHISQTRALKELGFESPERSAAEGRRNNPKITFDEHMRDIWYDICERRGVVIERSPGDGHDHMDKGDYIEHAEQLDLQREEEVARIIRENIRKEREEAKAKEDKMKERAFKLARQIAREQGRKAAYKMLDEVGYPELKEELREHKRQKKEITSI